MISYHFGGKARLMDAVLRRLLREPAAYVKTRVEAHGPAGERLAVVGWIRSLVRRADQREILFDLELTSRALFEKDGKTALYDRLAKTRSNLLRMWAED